MNYVSSTLKFTLHDLRLLYITILYIDIDKYRQSQYVSSRDTNRFKLMNWREFSVAKILDFHWYSGENFTNRKQL